jgi:hypothetical protein
MKQRNEARLTPAAVGAAIRGDIDNFITAATPGGIEAQEKAGQTSFVAGSSLPKKMQGCARTDFEKMGFRFGADVDDLFVTVSMPAGWKKVATNHSMWSDLIDDKGRKRAAIFYKAAFYDRSSHIGLNRRYNLSTYESVNAKGEPMENDHTHYAVIIKDCGKEIHRAGIYPENDYKACDPLEAQATAWLDEHYPQWKDATAYWD